MSSSPRPAALQAMRWAGAAALLWLAWKVASSRRMPSLPETAPIGFAGMAALQWVAPKAWLVAVSAAATCWSCRLGWSCPEGRSEGEAMAHYILFYDVVDGYVERRAPFRAAHLELARRAHERGELVLAGALADPVDGAVLVFTTREAAEAFARADPYVRHGLVTRWRIREWSTVIGG